MRDAARWLIVLVIALAVIGLIAYARGPKHHHGDDVGALHSGIARAESPTEAPSWL